MNWCFYVELNVFLVGFCEWDLQEKRDHRRELQNGPILQRGSSKIADGMGKKQEECN